MHDEVPPSNATNAQRASAGRCSLRGCGHMYMRSIDNSRSRYHWSRHPAVGRLRRTGKVRSPPDNVLIRLDLHLISIWCVGANCTLHLCVCPPCCCFFLLVHSQFENYPPDHHHFSIGPLESLRDSSTQSRWAESAILYLHVHWACSADPWFPTSETRSLGHGRNRIRKVHHVKPVAPLLAACVNVF